MTGMVHLFVLCRTGRCWFHKRRAAAAVRIDARRPTADDRTDRSVFVSVYVRWNQVARTAPQVVRHLGHLVALPLLVLDQFVMSHKNTVLRTTTEVANSLHVTVVLT